MRRMGILLLAFAFVPWHLAHAGDTEQILRFAADIQISEDATVAVTETITYDFGPYERHGIFRTIPVAYKARGGNYTLSLSHIAVTDENGTPQTFDVAKSGGYQEIKIGDADVLLTGERTYNISYTVDRAINYFDDHDEFYWNVTGNEWEVAIQNPEAKVTLPAAVSPDAVASECFVGAVGSTLSCETVFTQSDRLFVASDLQPYEGLTVVVSFPKGVVYEPTLLERILATVADNIILALPIVVFLLFFTLWWKRGRDPEGRGTIIAQYDAPDNLTPAEVGTILDEKVHRRDISAMLIHLAVNGYLDLTRIEKSFGKDDYLFKKLKDVSGVANDVERKLLSKMFDTKIQVKLSELKNHFYKDLAEIEKDIYESTVSKKYFVRNPKNVRAGYMIGGIILAAISPLVGAFGALWVASFITSGLVVFIFGIYMPAKTLKGVHAKEHILGLREYLTVAEKERLKFHNAPEKDPKHFEALLPFAIALGVEKEWAKQFEELFTIPPQWYHDAPGRAFSAAYFASAMSDFQSQTGASLASHPQAAGGGSGMSGGGFSGGGFGGGGGGSW